MILWIKLIGRSLCLGLCWTATYFASASEQKRNEDGCLLGFSAVQSGRSLLTFQRSLLPPSPGRWVERSPPVFAAGSVRYSCLPASRGALGHGLHRLCLNPPLVTSFEGHHSRAIGANCVRTLRSSLPVKTHLCSTVHNTSVYNKFDSNRAAGSSSACCIVSTCGIAVEEDTCVVSTSHQLSERKQQVAF
jgi:hypothetical protein